MEISGTWEAGLQLPVQSADAVCPIPGLTLRYGKQVQIFETEQLFLAIEGALFDRTPEELAARIDLAQSAYGCFAYVWVDRRTRETIIGTDRLGFFPLYHASEGGRFLFATSVEPVLRQLAKRTPDYAAWEELLTLGDIIGDKSTVKEITRLLPGTRIELSDGRVRLQRYWSLEFPDFVDRDTYITENNRLLDEAMALTSRHSASKVVLLSGGEDSRRLAIAAVRQNLPISFCTQENTYTRDQAGPVDADLKLASHIAAVFARPHVVSSMPDAERYFEDVLERDACLAFECSAHEWLLPATRLLESPSLVYDGIVGDITVNSHYVRALPEGAFRADADARTLARHVGGEDVPPWLAEIARMSGSRLIDRIEQAIRDLPASPHRLNGFFVLNHSRRKTATVLQLFGRRGHATCYPFLYNPLFVQSLSLHPTEQRSVRLHKACMEAVCPQMLAIPTTRDVPIPEQWLISRRDVTLRHEHVQFDRSIVSERAMDVFPSFRKRYRVIDAWRKLGGRRFSGRLDKSIRDFGWQLGAVARFSRFLQWLDA